MPHPTGTHARKWRFRLKAFKVQVLGVYEGAWSRRAAVLRRAFVRAQAARLPVWHLRPQQKPRCLHVCVRAGHHRRVLHAWGQLWPQRHPDHQERAAHDQLLPHVSAGLPCSVCFPQRRSMRSSPLDTLRPLSHRGALSAICGWVSVPQQVSLRPWLASQSYHAANHELARNL